MRLPAARLTEKPYTHSAGREGLLEMIAGGAWPTAVICGNDVLAIGALAAMLGRDRALAAPAAGAPAPRAKRVVQFFMAGAASHIDLFDFKPELIKRHGQPSDFGEPVEAFQNGLGPWLRPLWDFQPYGQSGKMLSEVVAPLGGVVDARDVPWSFRISEGVNYRAAVETLTNQSAGVLDIL